MAKVTRIEPTIDTSLVRKLRCAAYCRVSSSSEDQLHSYAAQMKYYSEVFNGSDTEELVDIYADEGITGTCEDKREEFKRLMTDCRRGKIDRIYVKSISRFARNTKDCLKNIRELKELGITILFEKENIDTAQVSDEMMITLMGGLAQEESTSISQNMRWSIKKRMEKGTFKQSVAPYGYVIDSGEMVIDPHTAPIVKEIFSNYLNGMGTPAIANELHRRGISTRMFCTKWTHKMIRYILKNEKYIGDSLMQKTYRTDVLPSIQKKNHGEKEQYYAENTHPAIISHEDYYKVQSIISNNGLKYHRLSGKEHIFRGIIKCSRCGSSYKRKKNNDKYYWVCMTHDLKAGNCISHHIPEKSIKQAFIKLSNKLILHHRDILLPLQRALHDLTSMKFGSNTKVLDIRRDIAALNEQKHVISRLRTKGFLDEKKYNEQFTALENKKSRLERDLNKLSKADNEDETLEQLDTLIDCFEERTAMITEFDDELFRMIMERIVVRDNILEFHLISGLKFNEEI